MVRFATILVLLFIFGCNTQPPAKSQHSPRALLRATVVSYEHNAEWDHFDGGSFATYDHLILKLDSNDSFSVAVSPDELPKDSPFRRAGTRLTFTLSEPLDPDAHLAWSAINDPTLLE